MQQDLIARSFDAVSDKYRRLHGLSDQQNEAAAENSSTGPAPANGFRVGPTLEAKGTGCPCHSTLVYSRSELIDLAELSAASANSAGIVESITALHLDREPDASAQPQHNIAQQHTNGNAASSRRNGKGPSGNNQAREGASQAQHASYQQQQAAQSKQALQQQHQPAQQQEPEDSPQQQYSEEDWNAYWQYYGYTSAPPQPPSAPPPLCSQHIAQLQQMMAGSSGAQPSANSQTAVTASADDTRSALQSRADNIQGGDLTALLMSWFDAGYQTGKMEAHLQAAQSRS